MAVIYCLIYHCPLVCHKFHAHDLSTLVSDILSNKLLRVWIYILNSRHQKITEGKMTSEACSTMQALAGIPCTDVRLYTMVDTSKSAWKFLNPWSVYMYQQFKNIIFFGGTMWWGEEGSWGGEGVEKAHGWSLNSWTRKQIIKSVWHLWYSFLKKLFWEKKSRHQKSI